MQNALAEWGWTEEQWNRICTTVTEEAQKARVAAQVLPVVGPEEGKTVAIPYFTLTTPQAQYPYPAQPNPPVTRASDRLSVDSDPTLFITTVAVNVELRSDEIADPDLTAALVAFRRAANYVARIEDALVFTGRPGPDAAPPGLAGIPPVYRVTGHGAPPGIFLGNLPPPAFPGPPPPGRFGPAAFPPPANRPLANGNGVFNQIVAAIDVLEGAGQLGPYACVLSHRLFEFVCTPTANLVLPRDRILPFLQGPLLRSSQIANGWGAVIALSGNPVELVVATDINVQYLQTSPEPRYVFRVSERVALRIKEFGAIALLGNLDHPCHHCKDRCHCCGDHGNPWWEKKGGSCHTKTY